MRCAVFYSEDMESAYCIEHCRKKQATVECIFAVFSDVEDSPFFGLGRDLIEVTADALEAPFLSHTLQSGDEMFELEEFLTELKSNHGVDTLVFGEFATRLEHVQLERVCRKIGLKLLTPMKGVGRGQALKEIISAGYSIVLTYVNGISSLWLGQPLDSVGVEEISDMAEFESIVVDGPVFTQRVEITVGYPEIQNDTMGRYHVKGVKLVNK